jgi:hypothetical protein
MREHRHMSPLTALFIGIFFVGAVSIAAASSIVLYGMRIADTRITDVLGLAGNTIEGLPDLINSLPPAIGDVLNDRRAPKYAANLDVDVNAIADERSGGIRPVVTVRNNGDEVVSMLVVRVAALSSSGVPLRDWTQVVATPIAIEDEWRGPIMPNATRHVVLSRCYGQPVIPADSVTLVHEISEIRVWDSDSEHEGI